MNPRYALAGWLAGWLAKAYSTSLPSRKLFYPIKHTAAKI